MVTTNINQGDVYITDGIVNNDNTITTSGSEKVVQVIPTTKIEYSYDNSIIMIPIPISSGDRGETPFSRVIDLKRIRETLIVTGFLADEKSSSHIDKRNDLLSLGKLSSALSVVWAQDFGTNKFQTVWKPNASANEYGAFILKMIFTETPGRIGLAINTATSQEPSEKNIAVNITLIRGKDI